MGIESNRYYKVKFDSGVISSFGLTNHRSITFNDIKNLKESERLVLLRNNEIVDYAGRGITSVYCSLNIPVITPFLVLKGKRYYYVENCDDELLAQADRVYTYNKVMIPGNESDKFREAMRLESKAFEDSYISKYIPKGPREYLGMYKNGILHTKDDDNINSMNDTDSLPNKGKEDKKVRLVVKFKRGALSELIRPCEQEVDTLINRAINEVDIDETVVVLTNNKINSVVGYKTFMGYKGLEGIPVITPFLVEIAGQCFYVESPEDRLLEIADKVYTIDSLINGIKLNKPNSKFIINEVIETFNSNSVTSLIPKRVRTLLGSFKINKATPKIRLMNIEGSIRKEWGGSGIKLPSLDGVKDLKRIKVPQSNMNETEKALSTYKDRETQDTVKVVSTNTVSNAVEHPKHYNMGKYETIEVIEDWFSTDATLGFYLGNTIKYVSRYAHKDNPVQDLEKAKFYLDRAISLLKKVNKDK